MKNLLNLLCIACVFSMFSTIHAQDSYSNENDITNTYLETTLNNIDSIPDFQTQEEKIKITGTIYKSDGVTPAKDVILNIYQPNEYGEYDLTRQKDKKDVYHQATIKTDADGKYTFYTFIPGTIHRSGTLKHIHPVIQEPGKEAYDLKTFYFDNDPLLNKYRRKRLENKGLNKSILKIEENDNMFVTTRDIVLGQDIAHCK